MSTQKQGNAVDPVDLQIGGDGDTPGIAQTVTLDDVNAIAYSNKPHEERREALHEMRKNLIARAHADRGGDIVTLLQEIDRIAATLGTEADAPAETASRDSLGMTPDERLDTTAPDDRELPKRQNRDIQ